MAQAQQAKTAKRQHQKGSAKPDRRGRIARSAAAEKLSPIQRARRDEKLLRERLRKTSVGADAMPKMVAVIAFAGGHVQRWRLRNGMDVLLAPDSASLVVAYHTWMRAGSRDDPRGRGGVAHLLEHLMFKGTHLHQPGSFDRMLERHGAAPNAATWLDYTMYHQAVPPEALAQVARLEADRLTGLRIEPTGLSAELSVVANERREQVQSDPDALLDEAFYKLAYGSHPYARPTLGTAHEIASLTRADVGRFYRQHYRPSRAVLVLAGAVEPADALQNVVEAYESVTLTATPTSAPRRQLAEPQIDGPKAATVVIDAEADRFSVGWLAVSGDDRAHPYLTLAAEIIAGSPSSRLHRALIDKGLASSVVAELPSTAAAALFEVRVHAMPGVPAARLRHSLHKELKKLVARQPITADELDGARNRLRRQRYAELSTIDGRAEALGHAMSCFGDPSLPRRWWKQVQSASAAQVQRALRAVLRKERRVELIGAAERREPGR